MQKSPDEIQNKTPQPTKWAYKALNMCNFCTHEMETCKASYVLSKDMGQIDGSLSRHDCVVACNKYISQVDTINEHHC